MSNTSERSRPLDVRNVTGLVKSSSRKFFLGPDPGNSNILLLLLSCTNKCTCGDMQDRQRPMCAYMNV